MEIVTFIAQWLLIVEILWITGVVIPFTILVTALYLIEWLILDPFTTFLISGNWDTTYSSISITATSPIMIMLYVAIIFGFIFLIVFLVNYFGRTIINPNASEMIQRLFWIFGILIFIIATPFFFLFFSMLIKMATTLIGNLFINNSTINNFLNTNEFLGNLRILLNYSNANTIDLNTWNSTWKNIDNSNAVLVKDNLFKYYNSIAQNMQSIDFNKFINDLYNNINNPSAIKEIVNSNPQLFNNLNSLINNIQLFNENLNSLISSGLDENVLNKIIINFGDFNSILNCNVFVESTTNVLQNASIFSNIQINDKNEIIPTNNIGFMLYYAITGLYANSIDGIWANITFIQGLFQSDGITKIIKSFMLGSLIAIGIAKAIGQLMSILIYRWFAILALVPYGAFSAARSVNDGGAIIKIWIRESITVVISLFVVALNVQIWTFLINLIMNGFTNHNIIIAGVSNNSMAKTIAFCIFVVISTYVCVGFTQKVLEIFNSSAIYRDSGMSIMQNEYANASQRNKNKFKNGPKNINTNTTQDVQMTNRKGETFNKKQKVGLIRRMGARKVK